MVTALIIALLVVVAAFALTAFYLVIRMRDINTRLAELRDKFPVTDEMRRHATETIANLNERIGSLNQKAVQISQIMTEVVSLRNLFTMPKRAGGAGERLLERALHDVLGADMYRTQVPLSAGIVDAAIKFKENIVPIDSKLSLENFNRMLEADDDAAKRLHWKAFLSDVKKRVDETSKYILPGEGTTDFALMYIASESVYYEVFVKDKNFGEPNTAIDYAIKRKVYPTSPHTIYPYLMTILHGMKALKIEENAKEILGKVAGLRNDFDRFRAIYAIIIGHLRNAHNKHNDEAEGSLAKLDGHISALEQKSK